MALESEESSPARAPGPPFADSRLQGGASPDAPRASLLQLSIVAAAFIAYALLSHYSESVPDAKGLGAGISIGPIALIGAVLVWRWTSPPVAVACIGLGCWAVFHCWTFLETHFAWADLLQQCGAYALLAVGFARTLAGGRVPMCTRMADRLHGPLERVEVSYTRRATAVWALFYGLLAAAIAVLFFAAPRPVWSAFVNFATFALIGIVFAVDHAIRRRVLPRKPGTGMVAALRQALAGSR